MSGREVSISGTVEIDFAEQIELRVRGLEISNPEWSRYPHLLRINNLAVTVDAEQLLRGVVFINSIVNEGAESSKQTVPMMPIASMRRVMLTDRLRADVCFLNLNVNAKADSFDDRNSDGLEMMLAVKSGDISAILQKFDITSSDQ